MKLLLDTHTFLWWVGDDKRLSARARRLIANPRNDVYVSVVTALEVTVKHSAGRLELFEAPETFLPDQLERNGFISLSLSLAHVMKLESLPTPHRDPFDRLLAAQTAAEGLTLVTSDRTLARYPIKTAW